MLSRNVLYYGREQPPAARILLRAGLLSMFWEEGGLRHICLGDTEVLRRIYVGVRDTGWGTLAPECSQVDLAAGPESFRLTFQAAHRQREIDFTWQGVIEGGADGSVRFAMQGLANRVFSYNRIGICVLHPMACAGQPCYAEHVDGSRQPARFPLHIEPHQPFMALRAFAHEVTPGVWAMVRYQGQTFEMEDQRNWSDASFKTYCPPLAEPYPLTAWPGMRVDQAVTLVAPVDAGLHGRDQPRTQAGASGSGRGDQGTSDRLAPLTRLPVPGMPVGPDAEPAHPGLWATRAGERADSLLLALGQNPVGRLPQLGVSIATDDGPLGARELAHLRALRLAHLRVELHLWQPDCERLMQRAATEAAALGLSLEVDAILDESLGPSLTRLAALVTVTRPRVNALLLARRDQAPLSTALIAEARAVLTPVAPAALIGAWARFSFVELNRARPPLSGLDVVGYGISPEVHADDDASLVENLEAQAITVAAARRFCSSLPIIISPLSLRPRLPIDPAVDPAGGWVPPTADPRQMALFGAAWTLGSLQSLAGSGVDRVTCYETAGPLGVQEREGAPPQPNLPHLPGVVFPLYHVLADMGEFTGAELLSLAGGDPWLVSALALQAYGRLRVIIANLTPNARQVRLSGLPEVLQVWRCDEQNAGTAMQDPEGFRQRPGEPLAAQDGACEICLLPYATWRIDGRVG